MMPEFSDISDAQRKEIDIWADGIIESNKQLMASGKAYWIWSERLYYQPGKDTWVDESWWIEIAKKRFVEYQDDNNQIGWAIITALEILVHHFPAQYRDYARNQIDRWYDLSGCHDPEYWWDLIVAVYPDHPATELLFEQQDSSWETGIAIRLGDSLLERLRQRETELKIKEYILSELEEDVNIFCLCDMLNGLDKDIFDRMFSDAESNAIRSLLLEVARNDREECSDRYFILSPATIMGWQEILDALAQNNNYLKEVLDIFKASSAREMLCWGLTGNRELTEKLVLQLYPEINSLCRIHHISFPSHSFALAIAWKRSQSPPLDYHISM